MASSFPQRRARYAGDGALNDDSTTKQPKPKYPECEMPTPTEPTAEELTVINQSRALVSAMQASPYHGRINAGTKPAATTVAGGAEVGIERYSDRYKESTGKNVSSLAGRLKPVLQDSFFPEEIISHLTATRRKRRRKDPRVQDHHESASGDLDSAVLTGEEGEEKDDEEGVPVEAFSESEEAAEDYTRNYDNEDDDLEDAGGDDGPVF